MKAFILCAGKGERLWPLSSLLPKCLWPIGGKPCARVIAEKLLDAGLDPVVCGLQKDRPLFDHEFRDLTADMHYDKESWGTGGQLYAALHGYPFSFAESNEGERQGPDIPEIGNFAVWYGDCLVDVDVKAFVDEANARLTATPKMLGVLLCTSRVRSELGRVLTEGTDGSSLVTYFEEKPLLQGYTWTGVGVFAPGIAAYLAPGVDLAKDVFPALIKEGAWLFGYVTGKEYFDIGSIPAYNKVNELASKGELWS